MHACLSISTLLLSLNPEAIWTRVSIRECGCALQAADVPTVAEDRQSRWAFGTSASTQIRPTHCVRSPDSFRPSAGSKPIFFEGVTLAIAVPHVASKTVSPCVSTYSLVQGDAVTLSEAPIILIRQPGHIEPPSTIVVDNLKWTADSESDAAPPRIIFAFPSARSISRDRIPSRIICDRNLRNVVGVALELLTACYFLADTNLSDPKAYKRVSLHCRRQNSASLLKHNHDTRSAPQQRSRPAMPVPKELSPHRPDD